MEAKVPKLVMSSSPSTRFDGSDIDGLRGHTWPHMATMSHDTRHDATEGAVHADRIYCDCDRFNSLWELVGTSWLEKTVAMTEAYRTRLTQASADAQLRSGGKCRVSCVEHGRTRINPFLKPFWQGAIILNNSDMTQGDGALT